MKIEQTVASTEMTALDEERSALVERVASGQTFQKSQKLREFFLFVCECSIRHGASEEVKEQQIGVHVFHRRPDYNTSEDSIVRVQARELRKRLTTYFETEGKNEPVIITIPKGGYLPVFIPAESKVQAEHESLLTLSAGGDLGTESNAIAEHTLAARQTLAILLLAVLGGALLFGAGWVISAEIRKPSPAIAQMIAIRNSYSFYEELLGPIGRTGTDTLLVLSNPKVLIYAGVTKWDKSLYSASQGPDSSTKEGLIPISPEMRKELHGFVNLDDSATSPLPYLQIKCNAFTGIGEAADAVKIGSMMTAMGYPVRLTQARFINWEIAARENLIILGNPAFNSWSSNRIAAGNFRIVSNAVLNVAPSPGEDTLYRSTFGSKGDLVEDYGLISSSTSASGSRFIILRATMEAGTYGMGEFFTDPKKMWGLYEKLRAMQTGANLPQNWEALIRVRVRDNLPVDEALVAVRLTSPPR